MNNFVTALVATEKNDLIPEKDDLYGKLIGEWELEWVEHEGTDNERRVRGEWIFSRILDGMAVQDLFIVPSRTERNINPQPDGEYGTTVRIYNPRTHHWDIYYGCTGQAFRLEGKREGDSVVHTEVSEGKMKWIISNITETGFRWEKRIRNENKGWNTEGIVYAKRK
jgi:hypothetical protein